MNAGLRLNAWYGLLILVSLIFITRLFYLQIVKHNYYSQQAKAGQLKEYIVQPERGIIEAYEAGKLIPIVLNEKLYTLFADPKYIKDSQTTAAKLTAITKADFDQYVKLLSTDNTRYVVLAKKLSRVQHEQIDKLKLKGVGTREAIYRTYPQGSLASQLIGFVNDEGVGTYGVEQALNKELSGKPGLLAAITDASGVPLVSNKNNVQIDPVPGRRLVLTIDIGMQKQLEDILKTGLDNAKSTSGSALIMEANNGKIKAMANYPSYNPAEFFKVTDPSLFTNPAVSSPLEVGSVMKPLTAAAALDKGVVGENTTYYDPSFIKIGDKTVSNIEEDGGPGTKSLRDILQLSLNTGAVWLLKQMGGGDINDKARVTWHDYMANHYKFGRLTGVEQGYEASGTIPDPLEGFGLNISYANSAFGQGMSATPLQMGAALSSIINGGSFWQPTLIDGYLDSAGGFKAHKSKLVRSQTVHSDVSKTVRSLMQYVFAKNVAGGSKAGYNIGGKTGTAQIAKPAGGYYEDRFNGMYIGFVGGSQPQYVIIVRVNEPKTKGYAGSGAAQPIFVKLAHTLINNFGVKPKDVP